MGALPAAGALFFYLRDQLAGFLQRLRRTHVEFRLTCLDALELAPRLLKQASEARSAAHMHGRVRPLPASVPCPALPCPARLATSRRGAEPAGEYSI